MTVREAVKTLKRATTITLGYGDSAVPFDKDDGLMMDAYGRYLVDEIFCAGDGHYEVSLAMKFIREGD